MSEYRATVEWERTGDDFLKGRYSREHRWSFDCGITLAASAAPTSAPAPWSNPACVDPEEAYVASISSCHMLTFLFVAYCHGYQVERYRDEAVGVMEPNERGQLWVSAVTLEPRIEFGGEKRPSAEEEEKLHHLAHEECYIANSIRTRVEVRSRAVGLAALLLLALGGCARAGSPPDAGLGEPHVRGPVESVTHRASASGVLVRPGPGSGDECGISATVDSRTRFLRRTPSDALETARVGDLTVGDTVAVYVEGPLALSCPPQGYASTVVIEFDR